MENMISIRYGVSCYHNGEAHMFFGIMYVPENWQDDEKREEKYLNVMRRSADDAGYDAGYWDHYDYPVYFESDKMWPFVSQAINWDTRTHNSFHVGFHAGDNVIVLEKTTDEQAGIVVMKGDKGRIVNADRDHMITVEMFRDGKTVMLPYDAFAFYA